MERTRSHTRAVKESTAQIRIKRTYQGFKIWRSYCSARRQRPARMVSYLNPYDKPIDLDTQAGLKLYSEAKKGLDKEDRYDGSKEKFSKFAKLMGKIFKTYRTMEIYKVPTAWEANAPANPTPEGIIDLFESNAVTKEQVKAQADKVWAETTHGANTPQYFKIFPTKPVDTTELDERRNAAKMKHSIAGASIWNSLTSDFQLDMHGQEENFSRDNEYDGLELWNHIRMEVNPSTKVGACSLKEEIESKTLQDFGDDVKGYNSWLTDTKKEIIRQEGTGKYNEYIRYAFKTYLTSTNEEFNEAIKDVKRRWTQDLLP